MRTISIHSQILEADRELALRRTVYPRQVGAGKMRQSEADLLIARMEAIRETLVFVREHEAGFRAWHAERKGANP